MCKAMQRFLAKDADANVAGLPEAERKKLAAMLRNTKGEESEVRHKKWLKAISAGKFSFGPQELIYIPKGDSSWKHAALGTPAGWIGYTKSTVTGNHS